jgi:hypothetical protein
MLTARKHFYNNTDTADASPSFDPLLDLPDGAVQGLPDLAQNAPALGLNGFAVGAPGGSGMLLDGSSPMAMLKNVSPTDARLGASGSPNATFFPTGATPAQLRQAIGDVGAALNYTGAGVKVGVLSDSFDNLGGAAADEASGALPPTVQVLKDDPSGTSTDEGRAMLQIVHDIAPGASLAFYTANVSEQDFANGILALANAGCKVICDDVGYFDEPLFQSGVVSEAIRTVEAEGVTYLTAAGNDAGNAYQAGWNPIARTSFDGQTLTDTEDFGGGSPVQTVTLGGSNGDTVPLILEWNQPYGAATANLRVDVFSGGSFLFSVTNALDGEPTNPWVGVDLDGGATYQIAVENLNGTGTDPSLIKDIVSGNGLPVTVSGANAGTAFGHPTTSGDVTVGAVDSANTPAFGVSPPLAEDFSSSALGSELLFNANGTPFSYVPDPVDAISVSGVDDVQTTVPGGLNDFFGTSAATPSVAAVAALMLQANPNLTPTQINTILRQSAITMANSMVSGAGLVQADQAVTDALAPLPTNSALAQLGNGSLDYLQFTGTALTQSDLISPTSWSIRAEGSFNNDQGLTTQLVAQDPSNPNNGAIDLLFLHDGNLYASALLQGAYWNVVGAGDFDGSGRTGIATQNAATGQIDLLWFTGTRLTGSELLNGTYQPVVGAADINGDGKTDLITQNAGGGPLDFLFFTGTNLTGSFQTSTSFWSVHDAANTSTPGQTAMLSQDPVSGALDYLGFNGTSFVSSQLENGSYTALSPVQGTQAALNLFPV